MFFIVLIDTRSDHVAGEVSYRRLKYYHIDARKATVGKKQSTSKHGNHCNICMYEQKILAENQN